MDEIMKEYREKFGYAGSSGTFSGIRDDEILKFITEKIAAGEKSGANNAVEYLTHQGTLNVPEDMWLIKRSSMQSARSISEEEK